MVKSFIIFQWRFSFLQVNSLFTLSLICFINSGFTRRLLTIWVHLNGLSIPLLTIVYIMVYKCNNSFAQLNQTVRSLFQDQLVIVWIKITRAYL